MGLGEGVVEDRGIVDLLYDEGDDECVGEIPVGSDDLEYRVWTPFGGRAADFRTRGGEPQGVLGERDRQMGSVDVGGGCPIDEEAAIEAAALIRRYPGVFGREISRGTADAFIAGTAIRRQMKLVTLNIRHFASVPIARLDALVINQDSDSWLPEA